MLGHKDPQQTFADLEAGNTRAANRYLDSETAAEALVAVLEEVKIVATLSRSLSRFDRY